MTPALAWLLVGLGFVVLAARKRRLALAAVTVQAAVLTWLAARGASGGEELAAAGALAGRTILLGVVSLVVIRRTSGARPVPDGVSPLRRVGLGAALALALIWLIPPVGLPSPAAERAMLCLVALGLVAAAGSRATLLQLLGIVLVENGLAIAALRLPGTSWLIELGLAVDLTLLAIVAGVFQQRIFSEFGAGDSGVLRSLRD